MKTNSINNKTWVASTVAYEDLRVGDYVGILNEVVECRPLAWDEWAMGQQREPIRFRSSAQSNGLPLLVKAICLPFVYVRSPQGAWHTFDVRLVQLARLTDQYAQTIWNDLQKEREKQGDSNFGG